MDIAVAVAEAIAVIAIVAVMHVVISAVAPLLKPY